MKCRDLLHPRIQALESDLERSHGLAITLSLFCKPAVAQDEQLRNFEKYQDSLLEIFIHLVWVEPKYCNS